MRFDFRSFDLLNFRIGFFFIYCSLNSSMLDIIKMIYKYYKVKFEE